MNGPFSTLISLCRHLGIQALLFDENHMPIREIDYGFREKMLKGFDYGSLAASLARNLEHGVYYHYEDDLKLHYVLFRLPPQEQGADPSREAAVPSGTLQKHDAVSVMPRGQISDTEDSSKSDCQVCCIGPVLFEPVNLNTVLHIMEKLRVAPPYQQDFMEFYHRVPLFPSFEIWNHLFGFFLKQQGVLLTLRQAEARSPVLSADSDYDIPDMPDVAQKTIEERYRWENALLDAVSAGSSEEAMDAYYRFRQYRLLPRTADPLRDRKNLLFTFSALLRKAVERSHVHPLHIDNLSRQLSVQIESALSLEQLDVLPHSMIRKYCMLVNNYSRRSYSALVQTCMDYMDFHYNAELSLSGLATMCSVSSSYLSALFRKEVGMTVTDYIHQARIRQSLTLLNASSLSIGEIASRCGFPDANYFTRTFKKLQGKTPKAYRENMGIH